MTYQCTEHSARETVMQEIRIQRVSLVRQNEEIYLALFIVQRICQRSNSPSKTLWGRYYEEHVL